MRSLINYVDEALFSSASEFSKADKIDTEFVDLGLSVNWAKCNLGAKTETDYGHYYMWGSTEPNDNDICSMKNAPFNNGKLIFNKKHFDSIKNKVCPDGILIPEYDVATQELGSDCRLPKASEIRELIDNTISNWTENKDTGINGWTFTSKTNKNKYIFIPASGYRIDDKFERLNTFSFLWSSNINAIHDFNAYRIYLSPFMHPRINSFGISAAFPIRPVQEK